MDNCDPTTVYRMASLRHHEDIARGLAAQRLAPLPGVPSLRLRIAAALVVLATRLAPAQPRVAATDATPA